MAHFATLPLGSMLTTGDGRNVTYPTHPGASPFNREVAVNDTPDTASNDASALTLQQSSLDAFVARAIYETDFLGDLCSRATLSRVVDAAIDMAAELCADADIAIPQSLLAAARAELAQQAEHLLDECAERAAAALADGIEAGDLDADGEPIPYPTYRSA